MLPPQVGVIELKFYFWFSFEASLCGKVLLILVHGLHLTLAVFIWNALENVVERQDVLFETLLIRHGMGNYLSCLKKLIASADVLVIQIVQNTAVVFQEFQLFMDALFLWIVRWYLIQGPSRLRRDKYLQHRWHLAMTRFIFEDLSECIMINLRRLDPIDLRWLHFRRFIRNIRNTWLLNLRVQILVGSKQRQLLAVSGWCGTFDFYFLILLAAVLGGELVDDCWLVYLHVFLWSFLILFEIGLILYCWHLDLKITALVLVSELFQAYGTRLLPNCRWNVARESTGRRVFLMFYLFNLLCLQQLSLAWKRIVSNERLATEWRQAVARLPLFHLDLSYAERRFSFRCANGVLLLIIHFILLDHVLWSFTWSVDLRMRGILLLAISSHLSALQVVGCVLLLLVRALLAKTRRQLDALKVVEIYFRSIFVVGIPMGIHYFIQLWQLLLIQLINQ